MSHGSGLRPERDLDVAVAAASETNRIIAAADAKAGLVLAAQCVVLAGTAAGARSIPPLTGADGTAAVLTVTLVGITVLLLGMSLWPRTGGPEGWFTFSELYVDEAPGLSDLGCNWS